mmetsp:Transcript_24993/g.59415  ORF Transcript_24993/g.59415 Transcript_24993/m.59415 type:complete len:317 (+) Transcript_24993:1131-2081(+)
MYHRLVRMERTVLAPWMWTFQRAPRSRRANRKSSMFLPTSCTKREKRLRRPWARTTCLLSGSSSSSNFSSGCKMIRRLSVATPLRCACRDLMQRFTLASGALHSKMKDAKSWIPKQMPAHQKVQSLISATRRRHHPLGTSSSPPSGVAACLKSTGSISSQGTIAWLRWSMITARTKTSKKSATKVKTEAAGRDDCQWVSAKRWRPSGLTRSQPLQTRAMTVFSQMTWATALKIERWLVRHVICPGVGSGTVSSPRKDQRFSCSSQKAQVAFCLSVLITIRRGVTRFCTLKALPSGARRLTLTASDPATDLASPSSR